MNIIFFILTISRISLTIFYRFRLIIKSLINSLQKPLIQFSFKNIFIPLLILRVIRLLAGNLFIWKFISWSILFNVKKILILFLIIISIIISFSFLEASIKSIYLFSIWFLNNFINKIISVLNKRRLSIDKRWFEVLGRKNLYLNINYLSTNLLFWETKSLKSVFYLFLIWIILFNY